MALVRKNLVVDPVEVRALAKRLGVSESEAVRRAVQLALARDEIAGALRRLRERGTFVDAFDRAPKK